MLEQLFSLYYCTSYEYKYTRTYCSLPYVLKNIVDLKINKATAKTFSFKVKSLSGTLFLMEKPSLRLFFFFLSSLCVCFHFAYFTAADFVKMSQQHSVFIKDSCGKTVQ